MCLVIAGGNMKEVSGYNISEQEFKKVSKWAEDVYNIAVIVD